MNIFTTLLIQPLANGLILFYKILGSNMGFGIIGFSLFLKFILNPLTKPYMESMKKMKEFAPQLDKLKKKYKGDKVKLATAQADFYRNKGVKPGSGCLPYLLQIVILLAFFNVFRQTLVPNGEITSKFNELLYPALQFAQGVEVNTKFLYLDVTQPDTFNLPGISFPLPGPILFLAAFVQFLSAKIMAPYTKVEEKVAKKTPGTKDDMQVSMQKSMTLMFPLMTLFIGVKFSSGLALYWFMFSLTQAYQQYRNQGWGGLTPWIEKLGLVKSVEKKK